MRDEGQGPCPNCGAADVASHVAPDIKETPAANTNATVLGCISGCAIAILVFAGFGAMLAALKTSDKDLSLALLFAMAVVAIISIPLFVRYRDRSTKFVRWMVGSTLIFLFVLLGGFAACVGLLSGMRFGG